MSSKLVSIYFSSAQEADVKNNRACLIYTVTIAGPPLGLLQDGCPLFKGATRPNPDTTTSLSPKETNNKMYLIFSSYKIAKKTLKLLNECL